MSAIVYDILGKISVGNILEANTLEARVRVRYGAVQQDEVSIGVIDQDPMHPKAARIDDVVLQDVRVACRSIALALERFEICVLTDVKGGIRLECQLPARSIDPCRIRKLTDATPWHCK